MGKATFKGFVPPDDPMFTGGFELFSIRPLSAFLATPPPTAAGAPQDVSAPPNAEVETEQDGIKAEALRRARVR